MAIPERWAARTQSLTPKTKRVGDQRGDDADPNSTKGRMDCDSPAQAVYQSSRSDPELRVHPPSQGTPLLALRMAAESSKHPGPKSWQSCRILSYGAHRRLGLRPLPKTLFREKAFLPLYHCGYRGKSWALPSATSMLAPAVLWLLDGGRFRSPLRGSLQLRTSALPPYLRPSKSWTHARGTSRFTFSNTIYSLVVRPL